MENRINKMDEKLDEIISTLNDVNLNHSNRITKLETAQKGIISVGAAFLTAIVGIVVRIFSGQH